VKTPLHERGSYICFDPNIWDTVHKVLLPESNLSFFSNRMSILAGNVYLNGLFHAGQLRSPL